MGTPAYARFRRADLQMQTPLDRANWVGAPLDNGGVGLPPKGSTSDDELRLSAQRYAKRCRDVGLEIIGLTDHNLGAPADEVDVFVDELRKHLGGDATVLVGFEVAAKVGRGAHFLCLFDESMAVRRVSEVLSELGLAEGDRFGSGKPAQADSDWKKLCDVVQDKRRGIIIAAHAVGTSGACSDATVAEWWERELIADLRLSCIELPRPRSYYADPARAQKASQILRREDGWGSGRHPIAMVNSSDCKRLDPEDRRSVKVNQDESWIGKRWTWIKTGPCVTIEGLRQAFLDHESRIRTVENWGDLDSPQPGAEPGRQVIESIEILGAKFLGDQTIEFSPELTTVIGGGGTGKSTIIEYLARALGSGPPDGANPDVVEATLADGGRVRVAVRNGADRLSSTLNSSGSTIEDSVSGGSAIDVATRFPIRLVRQREIFDIAKSAEARLKLVDELVRDDLRELASREKDVLRSLADLAEDRSDREDLLSRRTQIEAEIARFSGQITALEQASAPLAARDALRAEQTLLEEIERRIEHVAVDIESASAALKLGVSTSAVAARQTPHTEGVVDAHRRAVERVAQAQEELRATADSLRAWICDERRRPDRQAWAKALAQAEELYEAASRELPEAESLPRLRQGLGGRQTELAELDAKVVAIDGRLATAPALTAQLRELWEAQTQARQGVASQLACVVPETDARTPYVTVDVDPFGQISELGRWIMDRVNDQRRFGPEEAKALTVELARVRQPGESPVDVLCAILADSMRTDLEAALSPARMATLREACEGASHSHLERFRVPDAVTVTLYRQGGERAGTLGAGLSVGQQCIAVLTLLLAMGETPIMIDQPEDEIDNEFIYRELVPLIVRAKQRRQVIIATHNANIPVNGDAELIFALEARQENAQVRGALKLMKWKDPAPRQGRAQGPLDVEAVRRAVSEIMEGSEEAFQRRRAKYGMS